MGNGDNFWCTKKHLLWLYKYALVLILIFSKVKWWGAGLYGYSLYIRQVAFSRVIHLFQIYLRLTSFRLCQCFSNGEIVDLYLKSAIEGVIIKWATQINDIITEESGQAFANGQNPTPSAGEKKSPRLHARNSYYF